jgi:excisionase family DNA binding protein
MGDVKPKSAALREAVEGSKGPKPSPSSMLTVTEACEYLRISKYSLYQLIQSGKLPSVKIGSRRLIRMRSIQEFLNRLEAETGA